MSEAKFPPRASCTVGSNWIEGVLQGKWEYSSEPYEYLSLTEHEAILAAERAKTKEVKREMKWRNPADEWPAEGEMVAVVYGHNKEHNPLSYEIHFGVASIANDLSSLMVCTDDMTGQGNRSSFFYKNKEQEERVSNYTDLIIAWLPAKEFIMPEWTPHNSWWGKCIYK